MRKAMVLATALLLAGTAGAAMADSPAPASATPSATVHPDLWPAAQSPSAITDAATEARIA